MDTVHQDTMLSDIVGEEFSYVRNGRVGYSIGGGSMAIRATGGRAADVNDSAATALNHVGDSFAGAADVAHNLAIKAVVPGLIRELENTSTN